MTKKNIKEEKNNGKANKETLKPDTSLKKSFKIIIVESHVTAAISISQFLEFYGLKTSQVYNKEDAMAKIGRENPDLIILNPHLDRNVDGCEIIDAFKDKKFIITQIPDGEKNVCVGRKNIIGRIEKPVDNPKLLELIKKKFNVLSDK